MKASVFRSLGFMVLVSAAIGCSTNSKRAEFPAGTSPAEEIAKLDQEIQTGFVNQYDIVAAKEFTKAQEYLKDAKRDIGKKNAPDSALENVAYGRASLMRAQEEAKRNSPKVAGILEVRSDALVAGARDTDSSRSRLKELDDYLRSDVKRGYSPQNFSAMQKSYMDLELTAIQNRQLGDARAKIKKARDQRNTAPRSLAQAELDMKDAENVVAANRHDPTRYEDAVTRANASAVLATDVLAITNRRGANVDENAALAQVRQARQIKGLQGQVGNLKGQLGGATVALREKNKSLANLSARADLQAMIQKAQGQFNADEAEVFQQGDRLVIRLKSMNFPSGSANIPGSSLPLLAKVKSVAEELDPVEIVVEGHTDAVGKEAANQKLSEARAQAVATYFESPELKNAEIKTLGEGFNKPIASNKSKSGRAQNRRVDVIITPPAVATFTE